MSKKILMLLSLFMFLMSIFMVATPPPGDRGEEREQKCYTYCKKYLKKAEFEACHDGCVNGPMT